MIPLFKVLMSKSAADNVKEVLQSGYIGEGPKVKEFENKLKERFDNDYTLALNSGTSGLHLALHLLKKPRGSWPGLTPEDEVLTSPLTCTATNWPVLANNLNLNWVDVSAHDLNVDLDDLERKLSSKTKIILLVHWGGYPVDLDRVSRICDKCESMYGFRPYVIEDCAHAFGAEFKGKPIGSHGNFCMFSFQAIKFLTTIDGGALICPNNWYYDRGKLVRWYGIDRESNRKDFRCEADIPEWGFKFHMNDVCAAVGMSNLEIVDEMVKKQHDNSMFYDNSLKNISGAEVLSRDPRHKGAFWVYTMYVERRSDFINHMKDCNIMVSRVHERNDKHSCVSQYARALPTLDYVTSKMMCIPNGWWVTEEERQYVVDCIKKGW